MSHKADATQSADAQAKPARIFERPFGPHCVFECPAGRGKCSADIAPTQGALWENHGTNDAPTLTPSYNCTGGCGWHGYIVSGELVTAPPGVSFIHICRTCKAPEIIAVQVRP